jgi:two-component sensor histidine kinase
VEIQARGPEAFIERFSERIQALSANQDLLVRNEWRGVDIEDLVRAQVARTLRISLALG